MEPDAVPRINSTPTALPRVELVQLVHVTLPTPSIPPRPYTILERTPPSTIPQSRPTDVKSKSMPYQIPHVRNSKSKSSSKQP